MDDLVTWLRAQLEADEQMLRALDSTALNGIDSTAGWPVREYVERGLAEVAAKRSLLAWLEETRSRMQDCDMWSYNDAEAYQALALPYAARPGYREEWRP